MLAMACSFALLFSRRVSLARKTFPQIAQHFPRAVVAGRAGDAAARMGARAAQVEPLERSAIVRVAQHRSRRPELIERKLAVEDVAADQAEVALEVRRRERAVA